MGKPPPLAKISRMNFYRGESIWDTLVAATYQAMNEQMRDRQIKQRDRQTDKTETETDRQTDRQTDGMPMTKLNIRRAIYLLT